MKLRTIAVMAAVLVVLGVVFYFFGRTPEAKPSPEPQPFVWSFDFTRLKRIAIKLPRTGKGEAWVKHADSFWYFDRPDGPRVDQKRWGGGIPLILSGPGADRLIASNATAGKLAIYGLADPRMIIDITTDSGETLQVAVGDQRPDLGAYYVAAVGSNTVYSVDYTWYDVLERLVLDPPYPSAP
jgi:hypothetical protein